MHSTELDAAVLDTHSAHTHTFDSTKLKEWVSVSALTFLNMNPNHGNNNKK